MRLCVECDGLGRENSESGEIGDASPAKTTEERRESRATHFLVFGSLTALSLAHVLLSALVLVPVCLAVWNYISSPTSFRLLKTAACIHSLTGFQSPGKRTPSAAAVTVSIVSLF